MPRIKKETKKRWQPEKKAHQRRTDNSLLYNSSAWRKDRLAHISNNPLCAVCLTKGRYTASVVSDHIKPISDGGDIWNWNNRQALCLTCHAQKSGREAHTYKGGGENL